MLSGIQKVEINRKPADGGINREKFRMMEGRRLASAIDLWIRAHMQANTLNRFKTNSAAEHQAIVGEIAEHIDATTRTSQAFMTAVGQLKLPVLRPGNGPIKGQYGKVPVDIINKVVGGGSQITRQTIAHAVNAMAAKFGEDGVKPLKGKGTNIAELKILKMGNERIVATTKTGQVYDFNKIVNKNDV